ncbi:MAG TPA: GAF domain-containing protein [Candidatus Baltobacteraceae bacterium]|jgi:GAF domain-containing protein
MVDYPLLYSQAAGLLSGEPDPLANVANFAAFVFAELPEINWAGFYFARPDGDLVLGPFAGRPACTRLSQGRGVCGAAATSMTTVVVDDVDAFADHIACDSASRSEIVVPVLSGGRTVAVFDIDAPILARFGPADRAGIEALVAIVAPFAVRLAETLAGRTANR